MKKIFRLITGAALAVSVNAAQAAIYTEDFEAPFPSWESGWLGTNSNLQNFYGIGGDRGNNPDGLWISDNDGDNLIANIVFDPNFGASIHSFSIDVTSWVNTAEFRAYDMNDNEVHDIEITSFEGGWSDPGSYQTISFNTIFGLSRFEIFDPYGDQIEGNTSIDNVVASTAPVPLPGAIWLFGSALVGLLGVNRSKVA